MAKPKYISHRIYHNSTAIYPTHHQVIYFSPHLDNLLVVMTILFGVDGFARKYESEAMKREGNNVVTHCHIWASE